MHDFPNYPKPPPFVLAIEDSDRMVLVAGVAMLGQAFEERQPQDEMGLSALRACQRLALILCDGLDIRNRAVNRFIEAAQKANQ